MKLATLTLGCKVNVYDTNAMEELFIKAGYEMTNFNEMADVYLINTCSVTNLSDKKSRQMIRRAKKVNPEGTVVVTGCYAQVAPEVVSSMEGVNLIIGTNDRSRIVELVEKYKGFENVNLVTDIMKEKEFEELSMTGKTEKTRAYLKIQEGCDRYCSYCIIPFARGRVKSRLPQDVINEVEILADNGFKEIVLSGIHVASYGKDLKTTNLLELVKQVHDIDGIERIRFSSIDPSIINKEFVNTIKNLDKVCKHMHLSLQSGSENTLKQMNRGYTAEFYKNAVDLLRNEIKNIGITTDIIVGFPTETEEEFRESLDFCDDIKLNKIHVFPFSPKKGTKAEKMKNIVTNQEKTERSKEFLELDKQLQKDFLKQNNGLLEEVLFENQNEEGFYIGYTSNYILVRVKSEKNLSNKIYSVKLIYSDGFVMDGEIQ